MAITGARAGEVYRTALAIISSRGGNVSEIGLTRQLQRDYPELTGQTYQAFQAIARRAIAGHEAAAVVQRRPVNAVPGRELPVDPSIREEAPRYQYRVLIQAVSRDGTASWEYAVDVQSDQVLSRTDLEQIAEQRFRGRQPRQSYRERRTELGDNPDISVLVLSAGRRG